MARGSRHFHRGPRVVHGTSLDRMPSFQGLKGSLPQVELFPEKFKFMGQDVWPGTSWDTRALAEMLDFLSGHPHTWPLLPRCILKASRDLEIITCFLHSFYQGEVIKPNQTGPL